MLAKTPISLREEGEDAFTVSWSANLQKAGEVFASYLRLEHAITATPDVRIADHTYPRLILMIAEEEGLAAIDALRAVDMGLPSMPGLKFAEIVYALETEKPPVPIFNACPQIVCEYANVLKARMAPTLTAPETKAAPLALTA